MKKEEKSFFSFKFDEPEPKKGGRPAQLRAAPRPELTIAQILEWADAHHARTGEWPNVNSGWVHANRNEKWGNIDNALRQGCRGLPRQRGLARLLIEMRGAVYRNCPPPLTEALVLELADAYKQRTGDWPSLSSDANWTSIDNALRVGARSLPGGSSLARFLQKHRGRPHRHHRPLTVKKILTWADAHHARTGKWPNQKTGCVHEDRNEKWANIDNVLREGLRGLPRCQGLAHLLMERRGVPNRNLPPRLTVAQILEWADAHHARTGQWPNGNSGRVYESPNEKWSNITDALAMGLRGLPGKLSVAQLLAAHRGARNSKRLPPLTIERILDWADAHPELNGDWPTAQSGPIANVPGETWHRIDEALRQGQRSLRGGSSLARILAKHRGRRNIADLPPLTVKRILAWADAHFRRTGRWPTENSGPIEGVAGQSWQAVESSLRAGMRGLTGGSSLARLLAKHRGKPLKVDFHPLTKKEILGWADAHFRRTGRWPTARSGKVADSPQEDWNAINAALRAGYRGLPGGTTLPRFLAKHRGRRNQANPPSLTVRQILAWADAHFRRTGRWPTAASGPIDGAGGESWALIDNALRKGRCGLPGGTSLPRLLQEQRGRRNHMNIPPLTVKQILRWADAHFRRTGHWPTCDSGPVQGAPGEHWGTIDRTLSRGGRNLPGGSSLARLLDQHRRKSRASGTSR